MPTQPGKDVSRMRSTTAHLALPFFDEVHRELGQRLADWMPQQHIDESDDRKACKEWVALLGANQAGCATACRPARTARWAARWKNSTRARW
jgi:hypothetical protein